MKKIYEIPKKVSYKGVEYGVNATYRNILDIYNWLENGELDDLDQSIMLVTKIFGVDAPVDQVMVDEASEIMRLGKTIEEQINQERVIDFVHDFQVIRMDFIREYNIDITTENVSWDFIINGIENLSEKSLLNNLVKIRKAKLSDYKDPKQKYEIKKLQESVKLPPSKIEEEADKDFDNTRVRSIYDKLIRKEV